MFLLFMIVGEVVGLMWEVASVFRELLFEAMQKLEASGEVAI